MSEKKLRTYKESAYKDITDEEVQKMLDEWDLVKCPLCHKKISMLNAKLVTLSDGREAFVCKKH